MPQTDTANVIPELAGGWNDGLACFIFRFLKRPLIGRAGTLARHGYQDAGRLIGKRCLIYSGGRFDTVAIEPEQGEEWPLVIWMEYSGIPFH